ncbi:MULTISPECIES: hypothetical protein [Pseudomonas]|uniref:Uncharacterized protein n=1 Tax=Pseudomonas lutea TaxID=243924 RepID=A0A9X8MH13_9PSED|nr:MULTISPECIES: hypothetical protein [Pseudomonas]SER35668.1 hypothetical protein SAMN05216409_11820 [Pseudomonas lutea]
MKDVATETNKAARLQKIQVSIGGYQGRPVTLLCALDDSTNVLTIAAESPILTERKEGFAVVTNQDTDSFDMKFTDDLIRDAITSYYARSSQETLAVLDALARFSPDNAITKDSFDERGPRYRISPDIQNGQLAILAACAFADRQQPMNAITSMASELMQLYQAYTF